jgi:hypothetical protein
MLMSKIKNLRSVDPVWGRIQAEASDLILAEPLMGGMVHSSILHHSTFRKALSYRISLKLSSEEMPAQILREIIDEVLSVDDSIALSARADMVAVFDRDPACPSNVAANSIFQRISSITRLIGFLIGYGKIAVKKLHILFKCDVQKYLELIFIQVLFWAVGL